MIKKFVSIKHVGKLVNCNAAGDVELRQVNVMHADNGRGKTTIADILRSLQTGDASYIKGRTSLGHVGVPEVTIRLETENRTFKNGAWDQPYPYVSIFDETFVNENVYTGDAVAHEHRKNLYRVIVGAAGVVLVRRVDELDNDIRETNKELGIRQTAVKTHVPQGLTLDQFLALPQDLNVDEKIVAKEAELRAAERATEIAGKAELLFIEVPALPATLESLLARQLVDIQQDAETRVREHIAKYNGTGLEQWLSRGMAYVAGPDCPFCAQSLTGSHLISAMRAYFAQSYNALKEEIGNLRDWIDGVFSDAAALRVEQRLTTNAALMEFWRDFITDQPVLPHPEIQTAMQAVRAAALDCIMQKASAPLERVSPSTELKAAVVQLQELAVTVSAYNGRIQNRNAQIVATKKSILAANPQTLRSDLVRLRAIKLRHAGPATNACDIYSAAMTQKAKLEAQKAVAKNALDDYTKTVFAQYQTRLNEMLGHFGAGFRIGDVKTRYAGGVPSSTFHILVNNVAVELGDSSTPRSTPSFRNTLSAGDRRTLALSFFLAQLERDPSLAQQVVVFDDPFTSLDKARRTCTQQKICALAASVEQIIVLSHDPYFLRLVYDGMPAASVAALHLARVGEDTTISEWKIEDDTREEYFQNFDVLQQYITVGTGDPVHVARSIRPLLEKYLRVKFPQSFSANEWLGDFIAKIRAADIGNVLAAAQPVLTDLEAVNDYSKRYHHDGDQPTAPELIVDSELQAYATRTLSIIGEAWMCPASEALTCWAARA